MIGLISSYTLSEARSGFAELEEFAFGLDRILDGVAALIAQRAGGR